MPNVTFIADERSIECTANEGETLLEVALANDVPISNACGGNCACTTCRVIVNDGMDALSPVAADEGAKLAGFEEPEGETRLACQALIEGDSVVTVVNVS